MAEPMSFGNVCFIGPPGSGKTSIVESILGRKSPTLKDEGDMAVMNNNFKHIVVQNGLIPWNDVILSETVFLCIPVTENPQQFENYFRVISYAGLRYQCNVRVLVTFSDNHPCDESQKNLDFLSSYFEKEFGSNEFWLPTSTVTGLNINEPESRCARNWLYTPALINGAIPDPHLPWKPPMFVIVKKKTLFEETKEDNNLVAPVMPDGSVFIYGKLMGEDPLRVGDEFVLMPLKIEVRVLSIEAYGRNEQLIRWRQYGKLCISAVLPEMNHFLVDITKGSFLCADGFQEQCVFILADKVVTHINCYNRTPPIWFTFHCGSYSERLERFPMLGDSKAVFSLHRSFNYVRGSDMEFVISSQRFRGAPVISGCLAGGFTPLKGGELEDTDREVLESSPHPQEDSLDLF